MSCEYDYYTRNNGWKITRVVGSGETVGHVIRISGPESAVLVRCENHRAQDGIYENGKILVNGLDITCAPGPTRERDQIHYGLKDVTGSWTAEDNGGDPGGGEG